MSDKATAARYDAGTEIEFMPGGAVDWRPGRVLADEGGPLVEVRRLAAGAVPCLVRRERVRRPLPRVSAELLAAALLLRVASRLSAELEAPRAAGGGR